jgi:hypothetical protein
VQNILWVWHCLPQILLLWVWHCLPQILLTLNEQFPFLCIVLLCQCWQ